MLYSKDKLEELKKRWETKHGKQLVEIIKETRCFLNPQLFREHVKRLPSINDEEIRGKIDLRGINLEGYDFRPHIKKNNHIVYGKSILENIHFEGANLQYAQFSNGQLSKCNFEDTDLTQTKFKNSSLQDCSFERVTFHNTNFRNSKFVRCNFNDTLFRDTILSEATVDEKSHFGEIILDEKEEHYQIATIQYRQLKELYRNSSLFRIADNYHYREMTCKRKRLKWYNPVRWVDFVGGDLLCKYGSSLYRLILWTIIIVTAFGALYSFGGIEQYESHVKADFWDALYFSLTTFATLGPGDWVPVGWYRFAAGFEALLGAAGIALFTVILARKIIRD